MSIILKYRGNFLLGFASFPDFHYVIIKSKIILEKKF